MKRLTDDTIERLGGVQAIADLLETPYFTVCGWKRTGIPKHRIASLKMAAQLAGIEVDWEHALEPIESTGRRRRAA